jgi:hypothetical protein
MIDVKSMQLKHEPVPRHQPLILVPAVTALAAKQRLIPPAAGFDAGDGDQGLWAHDAS